MKRWILFLTTLLAWADPAVTFAAAPASAGATNGPAFAVRAYEVVGNTVLPQKMIDGVLTNYIGPSVDVARLRQGLGELQLLYRNLGFATVSVTLPQQRLTNGVVRVQIVEGKLHAITVTGNRYFSTSNVRRALPSLRTNVLINTRWLQPELDRANANADRQIYPVIAPGPDPGTSDLTLQVKDRLPLHAHIEIDDKSTPGTPLLRNDDSVQYNNLWQLEHQVGLEYDFSPTEMKTDSYEPRFFDQPAVASYSAFYRAPLGTGQSLRELYDEMPVTFGYDQVTHQFNLPPPTGSPEVIVYASRSAIEIPTRFGPLRTITNTVLEDISQQSAERDLTFNDNLGLKFTLPLQEFAGIRSSLNIGFDFKSYESRTFSTNLTYASLYALNTAGQRVLVTNQTLAFGANSGVSVQYMPISLGWAASRPDPRGSTSFTIDGHLFLGALESDRKDFQEVAGAQEAGGNFGIIRAGLTREQILPAQWSLLTRLGAQWASEPLISNEQFALGGTSGVRGYREGETYGDTGWHGQFDVRAPPINVGYFPYEHEQVPAELRASWFMDAGQTWLRDPSTGAFNEWGTGPGLYLTASRSFEARLTLGIALHNGQLTHAGGLNGYFSVGVQF
jgi:hemolysin activation/secretion protein